MIIRIPGDKPMDKNNAKHVTISPKGKEKCIPKVCFCETGELLKNGGFETPSFDPFEVFDGWILHSITPNTIDLVRDTVNVYEGSAAASIRTTQQPGTATLILRQYVDVTPGCLYRFKFAERLVNFSQGDSRIPLLVARLLYLDRNFNEYELLNIPVQKTEEDAEYNLHEETADLPAPCHVPEIIVQFSFYISDAPGTVWNLDAVSLQAISKTSVCC